MLSSLVGLYSLVVLVAVILSWVPQARGSSFGRAVEAMTEPVLEPVRRVVPPIGGLDLSPMIVLILLGLLRAALR